MIIMGYPGVGKSTIAKDDYRFIDLDSSDTMVTGTRFKKHWADDYCNFALYLSKQKYVVFVSTHPEVVKRILSKDKDAVLCYPSFDLQKQWVSKLKVRYEGLRNRKTHNAWVRARDHYYDDIAEMDKYNCEKIIIGRMDYNLKKHIAYIISGRANR